MAPPTEPAEAPDDPPVAFLVRPDGERLAHRRRVGRSPGVVWLNGFRSVMTGTKATALDRWAAATGRSYLRYDAFGHGESSGDFRAATIGRWAEDAVAVFDALSEGPQVLVGSSLGGWITLLLAARRPERVAGIVLIAPAPDFTDLLLWPSLAPETRATILREGECIMMADEGPYPLTLRMIEESRAHFVLGRKIPVAGKVRILQGLSDEPVPWRHALATAEAIQSPDLTVTLVKDGDHRLSAPADIARLLATVDELCGG